MEDHKRLLKESRIQLEKFSRPELSRETSEFFKSIRLINKRKTSATAAKERNKDIMHIQTSQLLKVIDQRNKTP